MRMLKPLASLMLRCGIGWPEFASMAKAVFVNVATEEYGIRGRPTNLSRVAAMTGVSRKEVRKFRELTRAHRWTPDMETTPANSVIHYWHYDPDFSSAPGNPKALALSGEGSFTALVRRYAGDIPAGAIRKELLRANTVVENEDGTLIPLSRYHCPTEFHEDFVYNVAFALGNLGATIVHNADLLEETSAQRRLERSAWTERLRPEQVRAFKHWVEWEGARFIEQADDWIGANELPKEQWHLQEPRTVGVGLYYFEED